jgi:hypothetical protein
MTKGRYYYIQFQPVTRGEPFLPHSLKNGKQSFIPNDTVVRHYGIAGIAYGKYDRDVDNTRFLEWQGSISQVPRRAYIIERKEFKTRRELTLFLYKRRVKNDS